MSNSHDGASQTLSSRRTLICAIGLFTLLFGVYLLSYSGIYHSGDEIAYVNTAIDLIQGRLSDANQGEWTGIIDTLIFARPGDIDLDGKVAGGAGPFTGLLAGVFLLIRDSSTVGSLQVMFLINIVTTALTAVFLLLVAIELQYRLWPALLMALLFGLATPAWVYSKQLFREPLAAMGLAAMLYFLVRCRTRQSFVSALLGLLALAIAVTTRTSTVVVAPFVVVYLAMVVVRQWRETGARQRVSWLLAGIALVFLSVATVGVASVVAGRYTRFLEGILNLFTHRQALAGLLISPGRGILFYAPILLLSIIGMVGFGRRHPWESLVLIGSTVCYLIVVSAHPMWWGGWNWGTRYLVPVIPFLILPLISLIDPWVAKPSLRWAPVLLVVIVLLSFVTQAIGVAVGTNSPAFENMDPSTFFRWEYTPFFQATQLNKISPDLAWLHVSGGLLSRAVVVVPALALILFGAVVLWLVASRSTATPGLLTAAIACVVLSFGVALWSVRWYSRHDTRYTSPAGFDSAIQRVVTEGKPGDLLVYDHWNTIDLDKIFPSRVSNFCGDRCPPVEEVLLDSWGPSQQLARLEEHLNWLEKIRWANKRVWLIPNTITSSNPNSEVQPWLDTYLFKAGCEQFSPETKLCLYYTLTPLDDLSSRATIAGLGPAEGSLFVPLVVVAVSAEQNPRVEGPSQRWIKLDALFGDRIRLNDVLLYWRPPTSQQPGAPLITTPGEPLLVELLWQVLERVDKRYKVSLQLLDSQDRLVHQLDREPLDGSFPITMWPLRRLLSDRYAFVLPADLPAGTYQLNLVVYDPQTGTRLPVGSGDSINLTDLTIVAQP